MSLRLLCVFSILFLFLCAIRFHIKPAATATPRSDAPIPRTQMRTHKTPTTPTYTPLNTFYQTIIDANIFRPLGWTKPISRPQFQLIATITRIKNAPPKRSSCTKTQTDFTPCPSEIKSVSRQYSPMSNRSTSYSNKTKSRQHYTSKTHSDPHLSRQCMCCFDGDTFSVSKGGIKSVDMCGQSVDMCQQKLKKLKK